MAFSRSLRALAGLASITLLASVTRGQTTWYVNGDNCPGPGSGTQADPFCTIQAGIDAALDGDECVVARGTYNELINFNGKAITLRSSDGADVSIIDAGPVPDPGTGKSVVRCDTGEGPDTVLEGFTLTGGTGSVCSISVNMSCGGGMINSGSNPTVTNCTLSGNSADLGGGMLNVDGSSPTVTNSTFSGNSAVFGDGGGMYNGLNSRPKVANCTFSGNSANSGGGMYNERGSPTVTNCTFSENSASQGGGMGNFAFATPTVTDCTFTGNSAGSGGGMGNIGASTPTVSNCTFSGNSAINGGGMRNIGSSNPTVTNCAFSGNSAGSGGGMYNDGNSRPEVANCTFSGNSAVNSGGGGDVWDRRVRWAFSPSAGQLHLVGQRSRPDCR